MNEFNRYKGINYCIKCGCSMSLNLDREGKMRPHCSSCGWIYYKNSIPAVACVVINELGQLLLIKRKFEPQAGLWALPSGYIEIWQSPEDAAISELEEETGLIGEIESFIGYYNGFSPIYEKVLSLGYKMKIIGGSLKAGDDALEAVFYDLDNLPEIAFWAHQDFVKKCGIPIKSVNEKTQ